MVFAFRALLPRLDHLVMWPVRELYTGGLFAFGVGAVSGIACHFWLRSTQRISSLLYCAALVGAFLEAAAALGSFASGQEISLVFPSGVPYITPAVRLDALSSFFLLTLSLLAACVAVYSIGYGKHGPAARNPALFSGFINLLLGSLTLVFTASDVLFFLVAWEMMVAASYLLVVTDHQDAETRQGGMLYILMSRAGTGMLYAGFLLFVAATGATDFRALHSAGQQLPGILGPLAFVLLFLGFGVKAGIIPLHIWLPAAHPVAPSNVSALMSGIVIKTGIYGMARVFFDFYGAASRCGPGCSCYWWAWFRHCWACCTP